MGGEYEVVRFNSQADWTLGALFRLTGGRKFLGYTCEDEHRALKIPGETCIPAGRYRLRLRTAGGFHQRYAARYGGLHQGMIEISDVPGFTHILIHCGNTDDDTAGCLLVGESQNMVNGFIGASRAAYERIYPQIVNDIEDGPTFITYSDLS